MDKVECLARAMCAADDIDPDALSEAGERAPSWHRYRDQARRVTAAFEAMQTAEPESATGTGTVTGAA